MSVVFSKASSGTGSKLRVNKKWVEILRDKTTAGLVRVLLCPVSVLGLLPSACWLPNLPHICEVLALFPLGFEAYINVYFGSFQVPVQKGVLNDAIHQLIEKLNSQIVGYVGTDFL